MCIWLGAYVQHFVFMVYRNSTVRYFRSLFYSLRCANGEIPFRIGFIRFQEQNELSEWQMILRLTETASKKKKRKKKTENQKNENK